MKTLAFFLCISFGACQAQLSEPLGEFPIYNNGLIYDEQTMSRLSRIVDSLNLKFKSCEPKTFRALPQGRAVYVTITQDQSAAKKAMDTDMSLEQFRKTFSTAKVGSEQWIYGYDYENYKGKAKIRYQRLPTRGGERGVVDVRDRIGPMKTKGWVYEENDREISAYFINELLTPAIPEEYARLVQYVDCMIDTTVQVYLNRKESYERTQIAPDSPAGKFIAMANNYKGKPVEPKIDWDAADAQTKSIAYYEAVEKWNAERIVALDQKMKWVPNQNMLREAVDDAVANNIGDAELEFYVARYLSSEEALQLKRMRRPVGNCSQDKTPRIHAAEICKLAAVTAKWDIFLRAHLDIMNDNFSRMSDGSYAWAGRGTYLKELEVLDIDAIDLLIGTSLRSENVSENHYYADIGRIGRALAETNDPQRLEERLVKMIGDNELDLFNRLLMAYVFRNYNYHVTDETRKKNNALVLRNAIATLPDSISKGFAVED